MIFEMNGTLGQIKEKLEAVDKRVETIRTDLKADLNGFRADLKTDLNGVDDRFRTIEKHWHWISGGIGAAIVLVPLCAAVVWWSLADKIQAVLDMAK